MKRYIALCLLLTLATVTAGNIVVSPHNVEYDQQGQGTITESIYYTNTGNQTETIDLDIVGDKTNWFSLSTQSFAVDSGTSKEIEVTINVPPEPSEGTISTGVIDSNLNLSTVFEGNITDPGPLFSSNKWIYSNDKVDVTVAGITYTMVIRKIDQVVAFDVYEKGKKISTERLAKEDTTSSLDPVKIKVIETAASSSRAELQFTSEEEGDVSITIGELGEIQVIPSNQNFRLSSLNEKQVTIKFRNNYDTDVQIEGVRLSQIQEGYTLDYQASSSVASGDTLPVVLTVKPKALSLGPHTQNVCVDVVVRGQVKKKCSQIKVNIPQETAQKYATSGSITITAPDYMPTGVHKPITVSGVRNTDDISVSTPSGDMVIDPNSIKVVHGTWKADFKCLEPGNHDVVFSYKGTKFDSKSVTVGDLSNVVFEYSKNLSKLKETEVTAVDPDNEITLNGTITINGKERRKFTPEAGKNYTICVELGGEETCETEDILKKEMEVYLPTINTNETIIKEEITATDEDGNDLGNVSIKLDGEELSDEWTADEGTHELTVQKAGFKTASQTFEVTEEQETSENPSPASGSVIGNLFSPPELYFLLALIAIGVIWYRENHMTTGSTGGRSSSSGPASGAPKFEPDDGGVEPVE